MHFIASAIRLLHQDQRGAAFIEYTALLGVILAVGLATLASVGGWANNRWVLLKNKLT